AARALHLWLPFFLLMIRLQLRSTLFPYTTLFRSYLYVEKNAEDKNFKIKHMDRCIKGDCFLVKMSKNGTFEDVTENELELMKNIDRKSTRLNSSHVSISYAVFCLKKKTNKITIQY